MIGAEKKIIAIGKTLKSKIYPYEETEKLPTVGTLSAPNLEKILSYSPDLVILGGMASKIAPNLKDLGIPCVVIPSNTLNKVLENIKILGTLTGKENEATTLYNKSVLTMENLKKEIKKNPLNLKGTVLYSISPIMALGKGTLANEILNFLGVKNIADNLVGNRPIISQEFLLKEDPDFLIGVMRIKKIDDILNTNSIIKETKAGKNNNIFIIDSNKLLRGSPRIFISIEEIYSLLNK